LEVPSVKALSQTKGSNHDRHRQSECRSPDHRQRRSRHEETERLTGLGARPLNEVKLPAVRSGLITYTVRQTTFADPEGNEFDLVMWQQQPE